jgi:ABC-type transport system involved in multi-copper enzyme maturation permease subunit
MTGFIYTVITVFRKEMWEHFRTKRLIVIGAIFAFVYVLLALYGNILTGAGTSGYNFERGANAVLTTVLAFTGFFPGLMAIVISYTAIVGERSRKSLILLTSKPVKRPALFLGKFLSSYFAIVLVYMVVMTVGFLGCVAASGKVPSLEEIGRAFGAMAFVLFTMAAWVAFAMFLSSYLKNPITVAVAAIMIWFLVMPIVSQIGFIYWIMSNNNDGAPRNVDVGLQQVPFGNATVVLSGLESPAYAVYNETGPVPGFAFGSYYTVSNLPPGNYSWTASGTGIKRAGTLSIDGMHSYTVSFGPNLNVQAARDLNVTLEKGGRLLAPKTESKGPFTNYTYENETGEGRLVISSNGTVLFSGNYTLDRQARRGMGAFMTQTPPDYVKYNQLINPDSAMTGYEKVLDPDSRASISPSEGAGALAVFFGAFMLLGLLVFTKTEMV